MVIAESGGTKTDWRFIVGDQIQQIRTKGLNPNYISEEDAKDILEEVKRSFSFSNDSTVYFYGAGCEYLDEEHWFPKLLRRFFRTEVKLFGDTLAAARASLQYEDGISLILGTGANVSLYENQKIVKSYSGYGYILGDEGSGAYMGKILLKDVLEGRVPREIEDRLKAYYKWDKASIIEQVYRKESPNKYMASLAEYIHKNRKNPYFKDLILKNFHDLFEASILPHEELKGLPLGVAGSVGYFFEQYLKYVADEHGYFVRNIVQAPIASLVLYHQENT